MKGRDERDKTNYSRASSGLRRRLGGNITSTVDVTVELLRKTHNI